jgi:hypothetical protein
METYHELSIDVAEHIMLDQNQEHYYDMMASGGVRAAYRTMKVRRSDKALAFQLNAFDHPTDLVVSCGAPLNDVPSSIVSVSCRAS